MKSVPRLSAEERPPQPGIASGDRAGTHAVLG
jgi:hypothetical protein